MGFERNILSGTMKNDITICTFSVLFVLLLLVVLCGVP
jgi:hypothetical protein